MQAFDKLVGVAAPLGVTNVNTDMLLPKEFLKTIKPDGLEKALFAYHRFNEHGDENPDFILNKPIFRDAKILVAGANFGCGSSREHACWALRDFGIRCVISASFADIFFSNMFKNGMLPVRLPAGRIDYLLRFLSEFPGAEISVDLRSSIVAGPDGQVDAFGIPDFSRDCLLNGVDEITVLLEREEKIAAFEQRQAVSQSWLLTVPTTLKV